MFFLSKKIRKLMELLNAPKQPADLQELKRAFEQVSPDPARSQFQKNLRIQLLMKHKNMAKMAPASNASPAASAVTSPAKGSHKKHEVDQKPSSLAGIKEIFKWRGMPFMGKSWSFVAALLLVVVLGMGISYPFIPAPSVQGYSLKDQVRKIAYNAPIKVVFTQMMDHGSVERAFHVNPPVEGRFEWTGNALMFYPTQQFQVGKVFRVSIDRTAKSIFQKNMLFDYQENFEITGPPQVMLFAPANNSVNVPTDAHITVHFDRPMVQLTSLDQGEKMVPAFEIEPKVKGRIKWLGTDSIRFIPENLQNATHYTIKVPKGTFSAEDGKTDQDFVASFDTLQPQLLSSSPFNWNPFNGPETKVRMDFNQIMKIDQVPTMIHFLAYKGDKNDLRNVQCKNMDMPDDAFGECPGIVEKFKNDKNRPQSFEDVTQKFDPSKWQEIGFNASYYTLEDYKKDAGITNNSDSSQSQVVDNTALPDNSDLQKTIILTPKQKLPYESYFLVKVDKNFGGKEGTLTLANEVDIIFNTVGEISVKTNGDFAQANELIFSQDMDMDSLRQHFTIEPKAFDADTKQEKLPDLSAYDGRHVDVNYDFQPSTNYKITVRAGVKDLFGKTLAKDFVVNFKTPPLPSSFQVMSASDVSVMDANKPPVFYLKTTNVDQIHVNFKKLTQDEMFALYSNGYFAYNDSALNGPLVSWDKKVENVFNKRGTAKVDFATETGSALSPGYYYFDVSSPQVINAGTGLPRYDRNLFIVSYSGLVSKISERKLLVWATSFLDGAPIAGMDITVYKNDKTGNLTGKTDSKGLVSFDLPDPQSADVYYQRQFFIIGQRQNDVAFTHSTWGEGNQPWDFNLQYSGYAPKYYAYVYTDQANE